MHQRRGGKNLAYFTRDNEQFYKYAMELLSNAGHVFTMTPDFFNHTSDRFIYFDIGADIYLSKDQRLLLREFDNVSQLFSVNGCVFFSMNITSSKKVRSQVAYDIHTMIQSSIPDAVRTVCIHKNYDYVMLSFAEFEKRCVLSDWYPIEDDSMQLLERLDIANMSVDNGQDYFLDMVYSLARKYYLRKPPVTYELYPIDFLSSVGYEDIDREAINQHIENELAQPQHEYGDDYVECGDTEKSRKLNVGAELDLMLLELDNETDIFFEDDGSEEVDFAEDSYEDMMENPQDKYEFDDVDPDIFIDPTLMVKWLSRNESVTISSDNI